MTSVHIESERVWISRSGGPSPEEEYVSVLTFAEVRAAAEILREYLLAQMPPVIEPPPTPGLRPGYDIRRPPF